MKANEILTDKNGRQMLTGDIVKIENAYFQTDNGFYYIDRTPGDPSWSGCDYSLVKIGVSGKISRARYNLAFWPLAHFVNDPAKRAAAADHDKKNATIEIIYTINNAEVIEHFKTEAATASENAELYSRRGDERSADLYRSIADHSAAVAARISNTEPETITDAEPEQLTLDLFAEPVQAPETPEAITAEEVPAEDEKAPETATDEATTGIYYSVNEETARRGWESIHMSDYKTGSATADYRAHVDEVREIAEKQKKRVSPYYHGKIDALVDRYARKLAQWFDDYNRNSASCPSWFIAGPANYPTKKHNRQMAREDSLWKEYNEIQAIKDKIKGVGTGPIDLADPHAREMLEERLTSLQAELERDKALNAYYRKHQTFVGFPDLSPEKAEEITRNFEETRARCPWITKIAPDYELTSLRDKIKRTQERLEELNRREAAKEEGPAESETFNGGEIVRNIELDRLQIVFDDKPGEETRARLKENGFRWSPKNNAWQRQLTENAERALKRLALA